MADVTPSSYLYGIIIFTIIILAGIGMFSEYNKIDSSFATSDEYINFTNTFDKSDELSTTVGGIESSIKNTTTGENVDPLSALVESSWASMRLLFSSFSFMNSVFAGLSARFMIPYWLVTMLTLMVTVMIAFTIWSLVFQGKT